jgi:putative ABC transport system permease protein
MTLGELWRRVDYLLHRSRYERELREEMAAHVAMKQEDEPRFGDALRLREDAADVWGWRWWDHFVQDVRFGVRQLRRAPVLALSGVVTLAIGLGVNVAVFQIVDVALLRPLPVKDPDSLFRFVRRSPHGMTTSFSYRSMEFYAERTGAISAPMGVVYAEVTLDEDRTRHVPVDFVTPNYLTEIGAVPVLGRLFDPTDAAADVVVLSDAAWRARYAADPAIVGRTIHVNGHPFTVAGVLSPKFALAEHQVTAWLPIGTHPRAFPGSRLLTDWSDGPVTFYGRLSRTESAATLKDATVTTGRALHQVDADAALEGEWLEPRAAGRLAEPDARSAAVIAIAGTLTGLVLLAACANLGTLLLARAFTREREMAIRLSVGASRGRLLRQVLTESLLLASLGAAAALWLGSSATRVLLSLTDAPAVLQPHLDWRAITFTAVLAVVATFAFGAVPALHAVQPRLRHMRLRGLLVGAQVATACTLVVLAGLLVRALDRAVHTSLGFDYEHQITIDPGLRTSGARPADAQEYWRRLETRLTHIPAVESLAVATLPPLGHRVNSGRLPSGAIGIYHHVEPSYFDVMGIRLLGGRLFDSRDTGTAVVSDSFAAAVWPGENPLGKLHQGRTIVGVVNAARTVLVGNDAAVEMYMPIDAEHLPDGFLIVRVRDDPRTMLPQIVSAARDIDPKILPSVAVLSDAFDERVQIPARSAMVAGALGTVALLLAATGIAGLIGFTTSQRVREIGVRLALGARPRHIVEALVAHYRLPVAAGAAIGFVIASVMAFVLRSELFGVSPVDPVSYAATSALLVLFAAAASLGPLRRALRVDPVTVLRAE